MEIIIEYVLLDNFLIDALLLVLTYRTLKMPISKAGIVLAGMFGAGFAVVSPLIDVSGILAILMKLAVAFVMALMSCFTFKKLISRYALFVLYTFAFGGTLIAVFNSLGTSVYDSLYIGYVSTLPLGTILISCLFFAMAMFRLLKYVFKTRFYASNSCEVIVKVNNKTAKIKGFIDTGNTLHNSMGKPVLVVPEKVLQNWFTPHERLNIMFGKEVSNIYNLETLNVGSMGGTYKMKVFDCEILVNGETKAGAIGVATGKLKCGDCQAILNQELVGVSK